MALPQMIYAWKPAIEITILWFIIYHVMLFFEGRRAIQALRGIIIILVAFFVFRRFNFEVLDWLLTKLFAVSIIGILIVFHPEIRQGLARLGRRHIFGSALREEEVEHVLKQVLAAAENLCRNKIGALVAIEKNDPLASYIETGVLIDSRVSSELIQTIFTPNSLLHDGGLVVQHGRIVAAGCLFPLSQNQVLSRIYGTRHRAAMGLSEETDAIAVVVSEERQDMSLVHEGKLYRDLSQEELFSRIKEIIKTR